jgi:hypothetical protein
LVIVHAILLIVGTQALTPVRCALQAPQGCATWLLTHPLSQLQPVVADMARGGSQPSWAGWAGERIVWSSLTMPIVATFNDVGARCVPPAPLPLPPLLLNHLGVRPP